MPVAHFTRARDTSNSTLGDDTPASTSTSSTPLERRPGRMATRLAKSRPVEREAGQASDSPIGGSANRGAQVGPSKSAHQVHHPMRTANRLAAAPRPRVQANRNRDRNRNPVPTNQRALYRQFARAMAYRRALNNSLSRMELAGKAGHTFDDKRVLDRALGRVEPGKITPANYEHLYRRGGIAGAIVDKIVVTALRSGADIIEGDGTDQRDYKTAWELEVQKLFKRLRVWDVLQEAFIECRKGRYSIIVINTALPGDVANPLEQPLTTIPGGDAVLNLRPYGETKIAEFLSNRELITDETDPKFGYPEFYKVKIGKHLEKKIHHSRVIHISNSLTPWSDPVLERVWDLFDDLQKTQGGGSEGFFQNIGAKDVWNIDPEAEFESTEIGSGDGVTGDGGDIDYDENPATIEEAIAGHRHSAIDDLILQGIERLPRDVETPDISNNTEALERHIAAASGYPHAVLLGNKEGRLAGEQDDAGYRDDSIGYREGFCDRHLMLLLDMLLAIRALSPVSEYTTSWRKTEKHSPVEKSVIVNNYAQANMRQEKADGRVMVEPNEVRRDVLGYEELEQDVGEDDSSGNNGNDVTASIRHNALDEDAPAEVIRLDNTINEYESRLTRRLNKAIKEARKTLNDDASNVDDVVDTLGETLADNEFDAFLLDVLNSHAKVELETAEDNGTFLRNAAQRNAQLDISFDTANPRAVEWATQYASNAIDDLTDDARRGLNTVISTATELGYTTPQTAKLISNNIGLASNEIDYVTNLARNLNNAQVGTTVKWGRNKLKVDKVLTQRQIDKHVNGYISHLLEVRKKRLSRSLLSHATNEGIFELQLQAKEQDLLPSNVERVYIENTKRHADRGGTTVAIGERFPVEPGHDANCGCTSGLQTK